MQDILPEKIRIRKDKKGFSNPREKWFRTNDFKNLINSILDSSGFSSLGYFNPEECKKAYKKHLSGEADMSKDIWKWINVYTWQSIYINLL